MRSRCQQTHPRLYTILECSQTRLLLQGSAGIQLLVKPIWCSSKQHQPPFCSPLSKPATMAAPSKDLIEDITTRFILTAPAEQLQ